MARAERTARAATPSLLNSCRNRPAQLARSEEVVGRERGGAAACRLFHASTRYRRDCVTSPKTSASSTTSCEGRPRRRYDRGDRRASEQIGITGSDTWGRLSRITTCMSCQAAGCRRWIEMDLEPARFLARGRCYRGCSAPHAGDAGESERRSRRDFYGDHAALADDRLSSAPRPAAPIEWVATAKSRCRLAGAALSVRTRIASQSEPPAGLRR